MNPSTKETPVKTRVLILFFVLCLGIRYATARSIVGVNSSNQVFVFDSATPTGISSPVAITGLVSGDQIHGIDYRPASGVLYALGISSGGDTGRIYTIAINGATAVATLIGTNFSTTLSTAQFYGFDFDPTADRIRITSTNGQNLRVNPDTGTLAGTDTNLTAGHAVVGLAYDRNDRNPNTATTLFGIDFTNDTLVRIGGVNGSPSPNGGVVTTIGSTGLLTQSLNISFDIAEDGVAFASMPVLVSGVQTYRFYTMNLTTGAATLVGNIGTGAVVIRGITAVPSPVANIDSGKFFATIQTAINDALTFNGHTIVVNAGTYNELVTVNKQLTFLGAKSGIIATSGFRGVNESVVRGNATHSSAFHILASNVTIDGFTVQDTSDPNNFGAGIFMGPNLFGAEIRNNIIQNNISGIQVSNNLESVPLIIERNLFKNNNMPGPVSGTAIYTDQFVAGTTFTNAVIDNNSFVGNSNVGVLIGATSAGFGKNIAITNNVMDSNGNGALIFNATNVFIIANDFIHSVGSQLVLGGGNDGVDISENFISGGTTRGIRVGDFGGGGTNSNVVLGSNYIAANPTAGLEIDSAANSYTGALMAQYNYWGSGNGPTNANNPGGSGDKLVDPASQVFFQPFRSDATDQQNLTGFQCYPAPTFYGINSANNNLIKFTSADPQNFTTTPITGLVGGDTIIAIDFRPATGELFGLSSGSRLYVINPITGAATQRGTSGAFTLSGVAFGFDFNPVTDRIRVVSDTNQDLRLNPNDGTLAGVDTPLAYAAGDPHVGLSPDADGTAYTNNYPGATRTTLYQIDTALNILAHQGSIFGAPTSPNSGQLFSMGALGIDPDDATKANTAFDVYSPVPGVNRAFAALSTTGTSSNFYEVNLISGIVSGGVPIGAISPGVALVRGLAAAPTGFFQFSAPGYFVAENAGAATITINRVGGSEGTVNVRFITTDGTATAGSDYTPVNQIVTFGPGETTKTVQVPIINDTTDEPNETILLKLLDQPGGGFLGNPFTAVISIVDDDVATPTLTAQSASTAAVGESIFDVATISSTSFLGGTLTFQLFGPNDNSCGSAPIFTSTVQVNGNGNYASAPFTPTTPGTYRWVVSYSGDVDHNAMVSTACNGANQAFDATATVLGNIATRLRVETGDNILIAGFIITGTQPKKVIVRGIGTSLQLADKLQDPTLELRDSTGALIQANDNWVESPNKQAIIDTGIPPTSDSESAIVATLPANNAGYTAILRGANNGTGIGVVEAYDLNRLVDSQLANISTRGFVSTGDNVLFAGTIVVGKNPRNVIVRAIGPSLSIQGKMDDPTLELRDSNGGLIEFNDNWVDSPNKQAIINSGVPPTNDKESAIVATLTGNNTNYTAIVRGVNNTTGIAVVEVYALP